MNLESRPLHPALENVLNPPLQFRKICHRPLQICDVLTFFQRPFIAGARRLLMRVQQGCAEIHAPAGVIHILLMSLLRRRHSYASHLSITWQVIVVCLFYSRAFSLRADGGPRGHPRAQNAVMRQPCSPSIA